MRPLGSTPLLLRLSQSPILRQSHVVRQSIRNSSNASYQPPTPPTPSNPHRAFYQSFGRPVAKVFLGALLTYQAIYWSWLKLESLEIKEDKNEEIRMLEGELKTLRAGE
ncbi:hypothetical protein H2199_003269 [Coniosporium tulheliwenetii]|uniref:Uncharacterized protein n=1 Tax=Coniosporium tulheliwenetii TaxID=3383036 RepID=A0ACC2ZD84_9PEZI|nr:hypothetical protein H2199_003269 [Cladosporium sp. JES 115]